MTKVNVKKYIPPSQSKTDFNDLKSLELHDLCSLGCWAAAEMRMTKSGIQIDLTNCLKVEKEFGRRDLQKLWQQIWNGEVSC